MERGKEEKSFCIGGRGRRQAKTSGKKAGRSKFFWGEKSLHLLIAGTEKGSPATESSTKGKEKMASTTGERRQVLDGERKWDTAKTGGRSISTRKKEENPDSS